MCTNESKKVLLWFTCTWTHARLHTPHAPSHARALTCTHTQINAHVPNTHLGGAKIRKCPRGFPAIQLKRKRLDNVYFCDDVAASPGRPACAKKTLSYIHETAHTLFSLSTEDGQRAKRGCIGGRRSRATGHQSCRRRQVEIPDACGNREYGNREYPRTRRRRRRSRVCP
jgi:hypothetical protein